MRPDTIKFEIRRAGPVDAEDLTATVRVVLLAVFSLLAVTCSKGPTPPTDPSVAPEMACPVAPASTISLDGDSAFVSYGTPTVTGGKTPLLTSCTPLSGTFFPVGSNTVTCTTTDALNRTDSCTFSVVVTRSPSIALTQFVAFGDSITWGEDGQALSAFLPESSDLFPEPSRPHFQLPEPQQYPAKVKASLQARYVAQASGIRVENRGRRGEQAGNTATVSRFSAEITGYESVLLMEGANDLSNVGAAVDGLRQMIQIAKSRGIRPYLATVPPEQDALFPPPRRDPAAVNQLNNGIRLLAAAEGVTLVDVFQAFPAGDLIAQGLLGSDGLHPTEAGYTIIAQRFFDTLKATLDTMP